MRFAELRRSRRSAALPDRLQRTSAVALPPFLLAVLLTCGVPVTAVADSILASPGASLPWMLVLALAALAIGLGWLLL
jgi:hypothetical protein